MSEHEWVDFGFTSTDNLKMEHFYSLLFLDKTILTEHPIIFAWKIFHHLKILCGIGVPFTLPIKIKLKEIITNVIESIEVECGAGQ